MKKKQLISIFTLLLLCAPVFRGVFAETADGPFTVAWMTDTQCLVYYDDLRGRFFAQTDWIEEHRSEQNIRLVLHTGDIMDNSFVPWEAECAEKAFAAIDPSLPLLAVAGNHDIGIKKQSYENWESFGFVQRMPEEHRFTEGRGVYGLLEAGGKKLVFVGLGYGNLTEEAVQWAKDVFGAFPDAAGVFFTHSYIDSRGDALKDGKYFDEHLLPECPNIRLVLCGHSRGTVHAVRQFTGTDGSRRTVDILMSNFQGNGNGAGALRLLRFDPEANTLTVGGVLPFDRPSKRDFKRLAKAELTIGNFFAD